MEKCEVARKVSVRGGLEVALIFQTTILTGSMRILAAKISPKNNRSGCTGLMNEASVKWRGVSWRRASGSGFTAALFLR